MAFPFSWSLKEDVDRYIAGQCEHHRHKTFREEYESMLKRAGIEYDERCIMCKSAYSLFMIFVVLVNDILFLD